MPAEHLPQAGFLQVKLIHLVACCYIKFSKFSSDISFDGGGIVLNIFKWTFFHAHVMYQLKNEFPFTQYFASRLLKQLFYLMPYSSAFFGINIVEGQRDLEASTGCPLSTKNSTCVSIDTWMLMSGKQHVLLWIGLLLAKKTQIFQDSTESNMWHVCWKYENTVSFIVKKMK